VLSRAAKDQWPRRHSFLILLGFSSGFLFFFPAFFFLSLSLLFLLVAFEQNTCPHHRAAA